MHLDEFLLKYRSLVIFTLQGMEKLNDATTLDFAKGINHNYQNLAVLRQIMTKRNHVTHLQYCGWEQAPKKNSCLECSRLGHNKCKL